MYFNKEITSKINKYEITMEYNELHKKSDEKYKIVKCKNCGASIDVTEKYCKYCNKEIEVETPWSITNLKVIDS